MSTEGRNLSFKLPAIQIANISPHVTPTSDSLSSSQRLCTLALPDDTNTADNNKRLCLCTTQTFTYFHKNFVTNSLFPS